MVDDQKPEKPKNERLDKLREEKKGEKRVMTQLAAIRKASAIPLGGTSNIPEVQVMLLVRDDDIQKFAALRERLETQDKERLADLRKKNAEAAAAEEDVPKPKDDGYDRDADEVTPKLERQIENWLKKTKERVDALP